MSLFGYADRVGYQADCLLNAVIGGPEDQSVSLRAALARKRGARWGCVLCQWLSWTVERHHCTKQLEGRATCRWGAVLAGIQIGGVLVVGLYGWLWI